MHRPRERGITLIELMIVVVVVGILAAIAYPAYQGQVEKTRRADGKAVLLDTAQRLERCFTRFSSYTDGGCGVNLPTSSADGFYTVTAETLAAGAFTLQAAPQGAQSSDTRCGTLTLTHTGQRGSQGEVNQDTNDCW